MEPHILIHKMSNFKHKKERILAAHLLLIFL